MRIAGTLYVASAGMVVPEYIAVADAWQSVALLHKAMATVSRLASVFNMVNLTVMACAPVGAMIQLHLALAEYLPAPSETIPANSMRVSPDVAHVLVLTRSDDSDVMIATNPSRTVAASEVKRTRIGPLVETDAGSAVPDDVWRVLQPETPSEGVGSCHKPPHRQVKPAHAYFPRHDNRGSRNRGKPQWHSQNKTLRTKQAHVIRLYSQV
jgi:hypothetical protein